MHFSSASQETRDEAEKALRIAAVRHESREVKAIALRSLVIMNNEMAEALLLRHLSDPPESPIETDEVIHHLRRFPNRRKNLNSR